MAPLSSHLQISDPKIARCASDLKWQMTAFSYGPSKLARISTVQAIGLPPAFARAEERDQPPAHNLLINALVTDENELAPSLARIVTALEEEQEGREECCGE